MHIRFEHPEGVRKLVGLREFPDSSAVAPLAQQSPRYPTPIEAVMLIEVPSFEVLEMEGPIEDALKAHGLATDAQLRDREGSQLSLSELFNRRELAKLQRVVNQCNREGNEARILDFDLRLQWGRSRRMRLEYDSILSTWVGSLILEIPVASEFAPSFLQTRVSKRRSDRRKRQSSRSSSESREGSAAKLRSSVSL